MGNQQVSVQLVRVTCGDETGGAITKRSETMKFGCPESELTRREHPRR